ncbi:MAG: MFS transporter [Chloroflexi bacterium]|nr:MAG: MFS transporter [Chloroflexota bacterium]
MEGPMNEKPPTANAEAETSQCKESSSATFVFIVLFLINFLNYLDRYVLIGAANGMAGELGFGIDGIGYLASAFIVLFTLSVVPLGAWADRSKRKNVIAICVAFWSLATMFTALAGNFLQLLIARMLLGIGEGGYAPASSAILADYFSRTKRAQVLSWWSTATLGGLMVGLIAGGIVAGLGVGAWRWAFIFSGIPGLLIALLAWRIREPRRNEADEQAALQDPTAYSVEGIADRLVFSGKVLAQIRTLLRIKSLLVLTAMQTFAFFVLAASAVYLPTLLQQKDTFGLSSAAAGLYTGIGIVVAGITGILIGGYLADVLSNRHPGARVLICGIGFLISAPCYMITFVIALTTHNIFLYSCFFFITTLLLNMHAGPSTAATQDIVPSSVRASAMAISIFLAHFLGDAASPSLVGLLARVIDPTHGQHFLAKLAGYDLSLALVYTCPAALVIAGLIGILGARWVKGDMAAAQLAEGV